jgi:metal-dependent hydrolase (beta-lactamase superfamily II)
MGEHCPGIEALSQVLDTGSGRIYGPTLGYLVTNMRAAGYQPEQVDEIYITHMHAIGAVG